MGSETIKKHLEELKGQKKFDGDFIDILIEANEASEDSETTAGKILEVVKKRYAQSKENKT